MDHAFVGALGVECELAFGLAHRVVGRPDGAAALPARRACLQFETLAPLQIDRPGDRTTPLVEQLAQSERLRRQVGQIAVPLGLCTEPSNVKARGHGCEYRYRCVGCEHFRTDPSNQAELRDYLHQLLAGREGLAAAVPQLAEWARRDASPSDDEIAALRSLIRRNDQIIDDLDPTDRAAALEAIATTRRLRAQLAVTIPERFKGVTRPARRVPASQRATEASLRQRIETLRAENQRLRAENASLKTELAIAYGQQRHANGG